MNGSDKPRPFYWQRHGGWEWDSPGHVPGDDEIRPGIEINYSDLPGDSESISSDWFQSSTLSSPTKKANFIPIVIIAFIMYRFL